MRVIRQVNPPSLWTATFPVSPHIREVSKANEAPPQTDEMYFRRV